MSLEDPETAYISPDVIIGKDTVIMPNTTILGKCIIGENNFIGPNTMIVDSTIGTTTESFVPMLEDQKYQTTKKLVHTPIWKMNPYANN